MITLPVLKVRNVPGLIIKSHYLSVGHGVFYIQVCTLSRE
jgi:hypothetical protein